MSGNLSQRLREWLEKSGYPLEMETASALRGAGFDITPSYIYTDQETGKGREIDVLATTHDRIGLLHVAFLIECKSSSHPWIIFKSKDSESSYSPLSALGLYSDTARAAASRLVTSSNAIRWFTYRSDRCGYGLRQAFGGENDSAFAASVSVIKATSAILSLPRLASPRIVFAFPIIVVDAPIFECTLSDKKELDLSQVEQSSFTFSQHTPNQTPCVIRVVHKAALNHFASFAREFSDSLKNELQPEVKEWIEARRGGGERT